MKFGKFIRLLSKPVGNNLENLSQDVENLKNNFSFEGRYNRPVENGYIDRDLHNSILGFQHENGLRVDGRVNPGGETEATLIGKLYGYKRPAGIKDQEDKGFVTASAAVLPPLAYVLAPYLAMSAAGAWVWWQQQDKETREKTLRDINGGDNNDDDDDRCYKDYEDNTDTCNKVTRNYGSRSGAVCHGSASEILASCRSGKPEDEWPRLQSKY